MALTENQILDMDTMEVREKTPEEKGQKPADVKKEDEPADEPEEEEEQEDPKAKAKKDDKPTKESEEEEEEEEEEEDPKKTDDPKEKEEEEEEVETVDDFLSKKYSETYGIKSEGDLDDTLKVAAELEKENDELKTELDKLKKESGKPKFDSEQEEKAYEFVKKFPIDKFDQGYHSLVKLVTLDLKTADSKIILEEKFILENPELTRDEALKKFNRDYNRKYTVKKEEFDGDEAAYNEEVEMRNIDLKADVNKARKFLEEQQKEFKRESKTTENKESKPSEAVATSIKAHTQEVNDYINDLDFLRYSFGDKESDDDFVYKFSKEEKKQIREAMLGWIGNPASYDAKGNLIGWEGIDENSQKVAGHLFGTKMIEQAYKHGKSLGEVKQADQIGKRKPDRKSQGGNGELKSATVLDQWEQIAKEEQRKRGR